MDAGPLLRKELLWLRRNRWAVLFVFGVVPALFALATTGFSRALPTNVPVAVAPASGAVKSDELQAARGLLRGIAHPVPVESAEAARTALDRERVYGVLTVRHGLYDGAAEVTLPFAVDGTMVPYGQPSRLVVAGLNDRATVFPADVTVDRTVLAPVHTLGEYLLAVLTVVLALVYAFTYVPYHLAREKEAFDRVRVESSLGSLLAAKSVAFGVLLAVAVAVLGVVALALGYDVALWRPAALAVLGLTATYLTATSAGIAFLTRFSVAGRFLGVVVLAAVLAFSNLFYPAGFFSPVRRTIARRMPVHHSMVAFRGLALGGHGPGLFRDRLLALVGVTVASLVWLWACVRHYERRGTT
ncbi:MAG: ABC transporter permease [Haloarculaceae archaeon]